jgi:hypothetical protein
MRRRRETVEHPFGTLKMRMGATHFLMKTLPTVAREMALSVLAYNLTRVMNIVGTRASLTSDQSVSVETPLRVDLEPDLAPAFLTTTQRRPLIVRREKLLRLAVSDYIDRIVDGRGLRQRVVTQPRPIGDVFPDDLCSRPRSNLIQVSPFRPSVTKTQTSVRNELQPPADRSG